MTDNKSLLIPNDLLPEMELHVQKIREEMKASDMDAILISDNTNIYYTSGRFFRGYVYIPSEGKAVYFVVRPVNLQKGASMMHYVRKPENIPAILEENGMEIPKKVGLEFDSASYSDIKRLSALFPDSEILNASPAIRNARMVKTPYELEQMRIDGLHQAKAYSKVKHIFKESMTDIEFQIELERMLRLEGCLGFSRTSGNLMEINLGSVLIGENADNPTPYDFAMGGAGVDPSLPVGADGSIIKRGVTIMIDMNGAFNGYQTDMTRVWSVGEIPALANRAHDTSIRILQTLEREVVPGMELAEIYKRAQQIVEEEGLEEYFMGHTQKAGFVGHGVGIELNEQPALTPRTKGLVKENMTLAIEPKFVIPHVGAVGIENTYVVTPNGLKPLTIFPNEIETLE